MKKIWEQLFGKKDADCAVRQIIIGKWLNWITLGAAVVGLIGLWFVHDSIVHADLGTMYANRAWISASWAGAHFGNGNLLMNLKVSNLGKEPATDLNFPTPSIRFVDLTAGEDKINWPTGDVCYGVDIMKHGIVSYPDISQSRTYTLIIPATSFEYNDWQGVLDHSKGMLIVGCVAYSTFNTTHHTQYCILERKLPDETTKGLDCTKGAYAD